MPWLLLSSLPGWKAEPKPNSRLRTNRPLIVSLPPCRLSLPLSLRSQEEGRHLQLQFQFRFTRDSEEVLFAFCFPYSYDDCNKDLECCEDQACLVAMCSVLPLKSRV